MPSSDAFSRATLDRLTAWCAQHLAPPPGALVDVRVATAGRSNITAIVADEHGRRLVVRRPPVGLHQHTAHDVLREAKIVGALRGSAVPVPPVLGICADADVIGAPFCITGFIDGLTLDTPGDVAALPATERLGVGLDIARCLAALHQLDPTELGLGDLSKPDGFVTRQLRRFAQMWHGADGTPITDTFADVHRRLAERVPADVVPSRIVHGDYRIGNVLVVGGRVTAVLDWELTALGHPTSDLAYLLNNWVGPGEDAPVTSAIEAGGFPTRDELLAAYRRAGGVWTDAPTLAFFRAFSYWRLASIRSGVVERLTASADPTTRAKAEQSRRSIPELLRAASRALDDDTGEAP